MLQYVLYNIYNYLLIIFIIYIIKIVESQSVANNCNKMDATMALNRPRFLVNPL